MNNTPSKKIPYISLWTGGSHWFFPGPTFEIQIIVNNDESRSNWNYYDMSIHNKQHNWSKTEKPGAPVNRSPKSSKPSNKWHVLIIDHWKFDHICFILTEFYEN